MERKLNIYVRSPYLNNQLQYISISPILQLREFWGLNALINKRIILCNVVSPKISQHIRFRTIAPSKGKRKKSLQIYIKNIFVTLT